MWSHAFTAVETLAPHGCWRRRLAEETRRAADARFAMVMTCAPGCWLQSHFDCDPPELEHLREEIVASRVTTVTAGQLCAPLEEPGLAEYRGNAHDNTVTGEEDRLESVLPLVKKYGAADVANSNDETGISQDTDVRFADPKKIVERAADHGIPRSDIVIDPLVITPATPTVYSGIPSALTISGGVQPYRAFSSNTLILPVNQTDSGSTVP